MKNRLHKTLSMLAICLLLSQTFFGSLPVFAQTKSNELTIMMTENGQPYVEGSVATSPVTIQVSTTSPDSAGIELSLDLGATWKSYDPTEPLLLEDAGDHDIWFRLIDQTAIEKRRIQIAPVSAFLSTQATSATTADSAIIYVNEASSAGGDGGSWATAYNDLQAALDQATDGNQIWIATGTYKPSKQSDVKDSRTVSFQMKNEVGIYGGFVGTETTLAERDFKTNETILSGDIGIVGDNKDNAYHVFYHPQTLSLTDTAILDGVTISEGNASVPLLNVPESSGGGMYNASSSPTVTNVKFIGNTASVFGGGMNNWSSSSPSLMNVEFIENTANGLGGGMHNDSSSGPTVTDVKFIENTAFNGGGMSNSSSSPTVMNVEFIGNEASGVGGGMLNWSSGPTVTNAEFIGNEAFSEGGGMFNSSSSSPSLTHVEFIENTAANGGGMSNWSSSPSLMYVEFRENTASSEGGGMYNSSSSPIVTNVKFIENTASDGGGMYNNYSSSLSVTNVEFHGNTASSEGGGMFNSSSSSPSLTHVEFIENTAANGGGMSNWSSSPSLMYVEFRENTASSEGGGMYNSSSSPIVTNVKFIENTASDGGGMYNNYSSSLSVTNVEFHGNTASSEGGGMSNSSSSPILTNVTMSGNTTNGSSKGAIYNNYSFPKINNSIIVGNNGPAIEGQRGTIENSLIDDEESGIVKCKLYDRTGTPGSAVTYTAEEIFIRTDLTKANYRLKADSPAIDKGALYQELAQVTKDLDGNDRIQGASIDLGAYEYTPPSALTNLRAPAGDREVALMWDPALDHASYEVYQYEGPIAPNDEQQWQLVNGNVIISQPTHIVSGLTVGSTYWFKVKGISKEGYESNFSQVVSAIPFAAITSSNSMPLSVEKGTKVEDISFPTTVDISLSDGTTLPAISVAWDKTSGSYQSDKAGTYTFTGELQNLPNHVLKKSVEISVQVSPSANVSLKSIHLNGSEIPNFDGQTLDYTVSVPYETTSANLTTETVDADARVTITGGNPQSLHVGDNVVEVVVTAENGDSSTYKVSIKREAKKTPTPDPGENGGTTPNPTPNPSGNGGTTTEPTLNPTPEPKPESKPKPKPELKPEPTPIHFSDIASDHWAADFIHQAAAMGIFKGYDDGRFGPNDNLTRAQSVSILVRMLGLEPSYTSSFTDIQGYAKETQAEINAAYQLGLVKGQNGKFNPTSEITRAQFALILYRAYEMLTGEPYSPTQIAPFGDIGKYDEETKNAISMLHELGIADGLEGNFMPSKPITRAQAAKILVNTAKILEQLKSSK
ncbi:S-layer homology domain-containing protein [Lysinibacillus sp. NPDC097287]|uniref:S-layer homology domain-containing protein n=1 Tax=Lysinibacillus sp. NPDC097287 TaxID=3364144 RepID=UPI00381E82FA